MASAGSAGLALRATAVAAMLAVMVLPSSGRCPSLGPAPPPPTPPIPFPPAPAPAPASVVSCGACARSFGSEACNSLCVDSQNEKCPCLQAQGGLCHECTAAVRKCTANCTGDGCDCGAAACDATCSLFVKCIGCAEEISRMCRRTCTSECMAKCNGP
ncbi:hypothetical protein D1007_60232 [Hordeum vulgare]|uniref:Uncharacterized protein n=1 Tax=Hordeum vulgare subsp. vulgare TaxID=112509 RepID=A0A8I7BI39_HORVV|nr:hypothetical protein D1007_60232 [Hordeum vulgare]